ncbi:MAG: sugar phosphate isomerase/epimerase family protein [Candidatus Latescibacterota bacterium]|nr:sugar phosphate isomerase/epimerase family protein [Candidatus Latescibacterota bacterium]
MKLGTCNEYFEDWPIEKVFQYAAEIGYDGIEIAPFTLAESVDDIPASLRGEIRRAAEQAGVEIIGLHWLLISPKGLYTNHVDDEIRNRTRDYFHSLIRLCGDLGGEVMVVGSPQQRNVQEGWDYDETWQRTVRIFQDCMPVAEGHGVFLCIEALSAEQTNFLTTAEQARKMVADVDHPHFQTMVDVCSGSSEEISVPQLLRDSGPHLYHVHVNDANKRGPGFGDTDFVAVLKTLRALDYQRYVSVEVFDFAPDARTIAAGSLHYLRGILDSLE